MQLYLLRQTTLNTERLKRIERQQEKLMSKKLQTENFEFKPISTEEEYDNLKERLRGKPDFKEYLVR